MRVVDDQPLGHDSGSDDQTKDPDKMTEAEMKREIGELAGKIALSCLNGMNGHVGYSMTLGKHVTNQKMVHVAHRLAYRLEKAPNQLDADEAHALDTLAIYNKGKGYFGPLFDRSTGERDIKSPYLRDVNGARDAGDRIDDLIKLSYGVDATFNSSGTPPPSPN